MRIETENINLQKFYSIVSLGAGIGVGIIALCGCVAAPLSLTFPSTSSNFDEISSTTNVVINTFQNIRKISSDTERIMNTSVFISKKLAIAGDALFEIDEMLSNATTCQRVFEVSLSMLKEDRQQFVIQNVRENHTTLCDGLNQVLDQLGSLHQQIKISTSKFLKCGN